LKDYSLPVIQHALIVHTHTVAKASVISEHKGAKVDVYDYAAQLNALPVFETIQVMANSDKNSKPGYLVRVTVKGTIVSGEGYHNNCRAYAELAACVNFKKRAEELHQGEKMMVKHINTLTSQTGEKFLKYCKMKQKDWEQYNFVHKQVGQEVIGQLFLGERLLSECVMHKYTPLLNPVDR
jgi:hypothetical protein